MEYIFHVRAWYEDGNFAIFTSNGVHADGYPPHKAGFIIPYEHTLDHPAVDIDFSTSNNSISVSWYDVFQDDSDFLTGYVVSLGTGIGLKNVATVNISSNDYTFNFDGLGLVENQKYFTTVTTSKHSGLKSTAYSDGCKVSLYMQSFTNFKFISCHPSLTSLNSELYIDHSAQE